MTGFEFISIICLVKYLKRVKYGGVFVGKNGRERMSFNVETADFYCKFDKQNMRFKPSQSQHQDFLYIRQDISRLRSKQKRQNGIILLNTVKTLIKKPISCRLMPFLYIEYIMKNRPQSCSYMKHALNSV